MKKGLRCIVILIAGFFLLELGLRVIGFDPIQLPELAIESTPKGCFIPKKNKGIVLVPGEFSINIDKLNYKVRHTKDSIRASSLNEIPDSLSNPLSNFMVVLIPMEWV